MQCLQCQTELVAEARLDGRLSCLKCGLVHDSAGAEIGYLVYVVANRGPSEWITRAKLRGLLPDDAGLSKANNVTTLIRIAAQIGLAQPDEIRRRLAAEDTRVLTEAVIDLGIMPPPADA